LAARRYLSKFFFIARIPKHFNSTGAFLCQVYFSGRRTGLLAYYKYFAGLSQEKRHDERISFCGLGIQALIRHYPSLGHCCEQGYGRRCRLRPSFPAKDGFAMPVILCGQKM
jgi:hypothetical protein